MQAVGEEQEHVVVLDRPARRASSRQARMATLRCAVGCVPPFTMSGMTMTTFLPGPA